MSSTDVASIIVILILLLLSAFFSSAETALTTANRLRLRSLADIGDKRAKTICKLLENPTKPLSVILICNNVVNLSASAYATTFVYRLCSEVAGWREHTSVATSVSTGVLTLLILIFGEITPKSIATIYADRLVLFHSSFLYFMTQLMTPLVFLINKLSSGLLFVFRIDLSKRPSQITEDELRTIVEVSHEEGVIESEERQMITNVVDFGDSLAKDVMVPRVDVELVSENLSYSELMEAFSKEKFTRMPVYSETVDNIVGTLNLKDIFFYQGDLNEFNMQSIIRKPFFTYEYKKTSELFIEMRKEYTAMALVLDEYGALAGIVTLEDLIEEIVGEIRDEYDEDEEDSIQHIKDNEYVAEGATNLNDVNEVLGVDIESNDYDSIAGHIINLLEHLPEEGEVVEDEFAAYTVLSVDKNRIDKVRILVKPEREDETEA